MSASAGSSTETPSPKGKEKAVELPQAPGGDPKRSSTSAMSLPIGTLASLLKLQDVEDHKPRLSKISWLPDVLVFRGSIIPTVLGPVLTVTFFSACVAAASLLYGKDVGLTNNVVPLLSVVVALLLVFRNTTAYERFAEGRKDFTTLISNARNLSRNIWVTVSLPPPSPANSAAPPPITRARLTQEKRRLIRLIVAFVVATKHHLRAEGGVHHEDLKGLLPRSLTGSTVQQLHQSGIMHQEAQCAHGRMTPACDPRTASPTRYSSDEEARLGLPSSRGPSRPTSPFKSRSPPISPSQSPTGFKSALSRLRARAPLKRRPTAVRVVSEDRYNHRSNAERSPRLIRSSTERTPLIKAGVKPDIRRTGDEIKAEVGLGRMVELGLPLIIAHEISRTIFRFRRMGCLEAVGPAGLVQSMTDQLGAMERIVQTPLPVIFGVHLKQTVTLFLFILPFTLVDLMGWKMVFIVTCCAFTMMGVEHIAAQVEMPFGTDACDLNLDLYCTELLCECEAILERLPEGDEDDFEAFTRSDEQKEVDDGADDDAD